jgi:hypothetical protein
MDHHVFPPPRAEMGRKYVRSFAIKSVGINYYV